MHALYEAIRKGGRGLGRTQLMRQALRAITARRRHGASWAWIAARVDHALRNGIVDPMPTEAQIDALDPAQLGRFRTAFLRLLPKATETRSRPKARAGPQKSEPASAPTAASPSPSSSSAASTSAEYLKHLKQLEGQST